MNRVCTSDPQIFAMAKSRFNGMIYGLVAVTWPRSRPRASQERKFTGIDQLKLMGVRRQLRNALDEKGGKASRSRTFKGTYKKLLFSGERNSSVS